MVYDDIGAYYIRVDENSGLLSVRNELTKDSAMSYTVSKIYPFDYFIFCRQNLAI